uniref:Protein kinase domain-containing protein n=1 Tax=Desertifilum tharense IPPAS B-1220 TaxID=1781255 RepID=A0ACD5H1V3_9CYAN
MKICANTPILINFNSNLWYEAQRLAKCAHPNIVKVLDFFEESGLSFIVMEYIPGQTLAELIKSGQPLPEVKAVHYLRQVAEALSVVHQNGYAASRCQTPKYYAATW